MTMNELKAKADAAIKAHDDYLFSDHGVRGIDPIKQAELAVAAANACVAVAECAASSATDVAVYTAEADSLSRVLA